MTDKFDRACQQEADERGDEADLYCEAAQDEIRCALALFRSLAKRGNRYTAVKVDGPLNWTIVEPRTQEALLAALETVEPPSLAAAAQPLIDRLNAWEAGKAERYQGWNVPDEKRLEVRCGDIRLLRDAVEGQSHKEQR